MMNEKAATICFTVNRRKREVPADVILYALVTDKLCRIELILSEPIEIFLSASALMKMLPEGQFFRLSRSCVVSLLHIRSIQSNQLVLSNGDQLSFSRRKREALVQAHRNFLICQLQSAEDLSLYTDLASEFRCFDHCPFPFLILELNPENPQTTPPSPSFSVRYINDAAASLMPLAVGQSVDALSYYFEIRKHRHSFATLQKIARNGGTADWFEWIAFAGRRRLIHVSCYQPRRGFCAFLLTFVEELPVSL